METKTCCAYNATRDCTLSSKVSVADSEREPLKVLKILIEDLARDSESGLWLTPLLHAPQLARLFPFDFVYLDIDLKVLQGVALLPGVPFPEFNGQVASALILPLSLLESTGTQQGDQLMVCDAEELEIRLAGISKPAAIAPKQPLRVIPSNASVAPGPTFWPLSGSSSPVPFPNGAGVVTQGTAFTVSLSTSWQITKSTMAAVLPEPIEAQEEEAASENLAVSEIAVADTESTEAQEEIVATGAAEDRVSDTIPDRVRPAEVAQSAQGDLVTASVPPGAAELEEVAETVGAMPGTVVVAERAPLEVKPGAVEERGQAEKPRIDISSVPSKPAPDVERATVQADGHEIGTDALIQQRKELATHIPAAIATSTDAGSAAPKKQSTEKKKKEPKEHLGTLVKRWLNCPDPLPERRSIIRLLSRELVVYTGNREKIERYEVRDVSPTGLYLYTEERWKPGDVVSLVLQRRDATEKDRERRVSIEVRVVRCDEGGVGLSWVWPEGVEFEPWKRVHTKRSDETDADYFLRELRLTRALGFLRQICLPAAEETKLALHRRLSNKRVASAVEIALQAQEMFGRCERGADKLAHPDMVRRILENGSWTEDDWIRQWWAGLLVSSCSADGLDTSNSGFIDMLAKLTPVHLRVLSFVCRKATESVAAGQPAAKLEVYCTGEELIEAVGSQSLARIHQTMGQLSSLGLLAENNKPSYVAVTDKVKTRTVPTLLALAMYARCNGHQQ